MPDAIYNMLAESRNIFVMGESEVKLTERWVVGCARKTVKNDKMFLGNLFTLSAHCSMCAVLS